MDYCGDYINACLPHITSLLYRALGQRATLIAAKPLPDAKVHLSNTTPTAITTTTTSAITADRAISCGHWGAGTLQSMPTMC